MRTSVPEGSTHSCISTVYNNAVGSAELYAKRRTGIDGGMRPVLYIDDRRPSSPLLSPSLSPSALPRTLSPILSPQTPLSFEAEEETW